jgi:hypothetical protein
VTIIFALLAACCNALNVTAQHLASISSPKKSTGWRFVVYLAKNPLWLFGWAALAGGFVFQALALHAGQMSVVQPLLITELIFALGLRLVWLRQSIRGVTWSAAAVTCLSLGVFLATAEPQGGSPYPASHVWAAAAGTTVVLPRCWPSWACAAPRAAGRCCWPPPRPSCGRWSRRWSRP